MRWRVFYRDADVNGEGFIPALQVSVPSDIITSDEGVLRDLAVDAAKQAASCHPFDGTKEFVCIPADQIFEVALRRTHIYEEVKR